MRRLHVVVSASRTAKNAKATGRVEQRRKTTTPLSANKPTKTAAIQSKTTKKGLRGVPGVGPVNEQLLKVKGIISVELLRSLFQEKAEEDDTFIDYLQKEVGIRNRHHCRSIARYFSGKQERRITLSVEGNISAGKTTLLDWLSNEQFEIRDLCEVVREPVEAWQKVGGSEANNLLSRFYQEPAKHAYEFQNYVFLTRMDINHRTFEGSKPLRLLERSVFSDRLVFIRAVHESKWMDDFQLQMYDSWFNPILREVPGLIPDGFIYLRAQPSTCMKRLQRRNRSEESKIKEQYLEGTPEKNHCRGWRYLLGVDIHSKHEEWFKQENWSDKRSLLFPSSPRAEAVRASIDIFPQDVLVPKELEGSVIWLGNDGITGPKNEEIQKKSGSVLPEELKQAMWQIPALVLDYDEDINVESDIDAKQHYARKVKAYFEFVQRHGRGRRMVGMSAEERQDLIERRFWKSKTGESLRRRWLMVDSLTETEIEKWASAHR